MRLILMGVSGSGKTTIGCHLSHASGNNFYCHFKKQHFANQSNPLGVPPGYSVLLFRCLQWRTCLLRFEVLWRRWFPPTKKCCKNGRWGTAYRWRQVLDNFEIISIIQVALAEDLGHFVSWPSWLYSCLFCSQAKIQRTSFGKSSICWGHLHLPQVEVELSNCVKFVS